MEEETQQFLQERSERIRLLHERQAREIEQFDDETLDQEPEVWREGAKPAVNFVPSAASCTRDSTP